MKLSIQEKNPLMDRMKPDFVQAILGKYGISRWRHKFKALILRQYPMLFTDPADAKASSMGVSTINHVWHNNSYAYSDPSLPQTAAQPRPASRILIMNLSSLAGIPHSSFAHHPQNRGSEASAGGHNYSTRLMEGVYGRVAGREGLAGHRTAADQLSYPGFGTPAALKELLALRSQESSAPVRTFLPPQSALIARKDEAAADIGLSSFRQQHSLLQPQAAAAGQALEYSRIIHHQIQTLQEYTALHKNAADPIHRPLPLVQKVQDDRSTRAMAELTVPATSNAEVYNPNGQAYRAQPSGDSLAFLPGSQPSGSLRLTLGKGIEDRLGRTEGLVVPSEALQREPALVKEALHRLNERMILHLTAPADLLEAAPLKTLARLPGMGVRFRNAPESGLIQSGHEELSPSAGRRQTGRKLVTASKAQAEEPGTTGRNRSLILQRPEPKAAGPKPVKPLEEAPFQEREAHVQASFPIKQPVKNTDMGTEELHLLAERVYQVLEKKMAIRKDRRGLR